MPRDEAPRTPTVSSSSSSTARTPRLREVAGQREAGRAGADDHDRMAHDRARCPVRAAARRASAAARTAGAKWKVSIGSSSCSQRVRPFGDRVGRVRHQFRLAREVVVAADDVDVADARAAGRQPGVARARKGRLVGRCRSAAAWAPWCAPGSTARRPASARTTATGRRSARSCGPSRWPNSSPAAHRPRRCRARGRWRRSTGRRSADRHACGRR